MGGPIKPIDVSLIIPVYNGVRLVEKAAREYREVFSKSPHIRSFEIILVSNNCTDGTPAICARLARSLSHIKHVDFPFRTLKGGAVIRGFQLARHPFVGFTDVDMSTSPQEFLKLIPPLHDPRVGAAIASRKMPDSILRPPQPFFRVFLGNAFALIRECMFGLGVVDSQCGAKIFKKSDIFPLELTTNGWAFDVELLYRVKQRGKEIREIGITWQDGPETKVGLLTPFTMFWELVRLRLRA